MIGVNSIIIKSRKIDDTELDNEKLMMDIENGKYYSLNTVASSIWDKINSKVKVSTIIEELLEEYDIDKETCTNEVIMYLKDLEKEKLIQVG